MMSTSLPPPPPPPPTTRYTIVHRSVGKRKSAGSIQRPCYASGAGAKRRGIDKGTLCDPFASGQPGTGPSGFPRLDRAYERPQSRPDITPLQLVLLIVVQLHDNIHFLNRCVRDHETGAVHLGSERTMSANLQRRSNLRDERVRVRNRGNERHRRPRS